VEQGKEGLFGIGERAMKENAEAREKLLSLAESLGWASRHDPEGWSKIAVELWRMLRRALPQGPLKRGPKSASRWPSRKLIDLADEADRRLKTVVVGQSGDLRIARRLVLDYEPCAGLTPGTVVNRIREGRQLKKDRLGSELN
jgi:hypothetical protein